jgi:hypothetical protein
MISFKFHVAVEHESSFVEQGGRAKTKQKNGNNETREIRETNIQTTKPA